MKYKEKTDFSICSSDFDTPVSTKIDNVIIIETKMKCCNMIFRHASKAVCTYSGAGVDRKILMEKRYGNSETGDQKAMVTVKQTEDYISYTLEDEKQFSIVEEKVIKSRIANNIIVPYRIRQNGKLQLIMMIPAMYKILSRLSVDLEPQALFRAVLCMYEICEEVEKNGFLKLEHLDLNLNHILVSADGSICMAYLPVASGLGTILLDKDSALKAVSKELAARNVNSKINSYIQEFKKDLQDEGCPFQQILGKIRSGEYGSRKSADLGAGGSLLPGSSYFILTENQHKIDIQKDQFIIGKNPELADGIILGHTTVSRRHCAVIYENSMFYIYDLGSKNGTFVNNIQVTGRKVPLKNGDNVRLADCSLIFHDERA